MRPHERTHAGPKADRLKLLYGAHTQISPVYGIYPDDAGAVWTAAAVSGEPQAQAVGRDGTLNRFWWIDDPARCAAVTAAMAGRWILIADGHHRYETAVKYREERRAAGDGDGPHDWVMMGLTAIEDPGLVVLPTHRLLHEWPEGADSAFTKTAVTSEESLRFALAQTPQDAPAFGLVTPGGAWILTAASTGGSSPAAELDVAVLEDRILKRAFGKDQAALAARGHPEVHQGHGRGMAAGLDRRGRRGPDPAPDAQGRGDRRRRGGRDHAAEVHVLLPEAPDRRGIPLVRGANRCLIRRLTPRFLGGLFTLLRTARAVLGG